MELHKCRKATTKEDRETGGDVTSKDRGKEKKIKINKHLQ